MLERGGRLERRRVLREVDNLMTLLLRNGPGRDRLAVAFFAWHRSMRVVRRREQVLCGIDDSHLACFQHIFCRWWAMVLMQRNEKTTKAHGAFKLGLRTYGMLKNEVFQAWRRQSLRCSPSRNWRSPSSNRAGSPVSRASDKSPGPRRSVSPSRARNHRPMGFSPFGPGGDEEASQAGGSDDFSFSGRPATPQCGGSSPSQDGASRLGASATANTPQPPRQPPAGSRVIAASPAPALAAARAARSRPREDTTAMLAKTRALQASAIVERTALEDVEARYVKGSTKLYSVSDSPALLSIDASPHAPLRVQRDFAGA